MGFPSYSTQTAQVSPAQEKQMNMTTDFLGNTIIPTVQQGITGATETYNQAAPGILNAAQNLGGMANQVQQTAGSTGESALRTGVTGLESLFSPDYESKQIAAALQPAQAQYMQNLAGQQAQFGGTGNLGSARQALAGQQLAGSNMANQSNIAAQVGKDIAGQRASAATNLAQIGQGGLNQALGAAGTQVGSSQAMVDLYNKYLSGIYGAPQGSYTGNFTGSQGKTGFGIGGGGDMFKML